jgi:FixJ family two-component response regulator
MSGPELARRLRPARPEMRVLYMSGYTDDAIARHGVLDANTEFLEKPYDATGLEARVRRILDSPKARS